MKIADMHCDTVSEIWKSRRAGEDAQLAKNKFHIDMQKLKKSEYLLQNFAMFTNLKECADAYEHTLSLINVFYGEIEKNKNDISVIKRYNEIAKNEKQGKISALLTIEEGGCCKGSIDKLEKLYQLGARMMTLTWNYPNELGFPNLYDLAEYGVSGTFTFDGSKGLTSKGFEFIERMEQLGMIIDVSHLSDAGFWDIFNNTKKPFVASHSNARALCRHPRNLTDDMIRAIAERGGVIGLNYYGKFLDDKSPHFSSAEKIARHARHIINTGGSECLGLGSDFDGIDGGMEIKDASQIYKLVQALEGNNFTSEEIENILYKNVLKVYKELL